MAPLSQQLIFSALNAWVLVDPAVHGSIEQDILALAELVESFRAVFTDIRWRVWTKKAIKGDYASPDEAKAAIYTLGLEQSLRFATPTPDGMAWIGAHLVGVHQDHHHQIIELYQEILDEKRIENEVHQSERHKEFERINEEISSNIASRWDELVMQIVFDEKTPREAAQELQMNSETMLYHSSIIISPSLRLSWTLQIVSSLES